MSRIFQEYDFVQQIGQGTFSTVYKANRKIDGLVVAIKVREIKNEEDEIMIVQEGNILKSIMGGHPTIPYLLDILKEDLFFFIIMEYLEGYITLLDWINSNTPINILCSNNRENTDDIIKKREGDIAKIFSQIISGVDYIHQMSVVHRDLKMENIMINPENLNVKIIDFGFSKITKSLKWTTICGSFEYMAPEILQSFLEVESQQLPQNKKFQNLTIQSEVWALGIILFGMTYQRLPFYHQNRIQLFNLILKSEVPIRSGNPYVSDNLENLILKMLQKDPYKRINILQIFRHPFIEDAFKQYTTSISRSMLLFQNMHSDPEIYNENDIFSDSEVVETEREINNANTSRKFIRVSRNNPVMASVTSSQNNLPIAYRIRRNSKPMCSCKKRISIFPGPNIISPRL